jgi:hypothetical protein
LIEVNNELIDIEKRLSDLLQQCNLDSFVSVETIERWINDIDEDFMTLVKMLAGLLDKENLVNEELFEKFLTTMMNLSHHLPSKKFNGKTFVDELKRRDEQGEPTKVFFTSTKLPSTEWVDYYYKALHIMNKQDFFQASKGFDKTFEKLLETKTTSIDIYRVFCNAGLTYLFSGKPVLGVQCIEAAFELNPQYTFASEQMQKFQQGDFNNIIQLGLLTQIKNNLETWEKRPNYLNLDIVMKWPEKKILDKLKSYGVTVDKTEFIKEAKTVNHPETLAHKLFDPQASITEKDDDFIWIAAYALWDIYCPDEPTIPGFNDVLHEAFLFVSTDDKKKMSKKVFEKTCTRYFKRLHAYIFSDKNDFLKQWQNTAEVDMDPGYDLTIFLTSLLSNPDLEKDVLAVVHHLNKQIPHPSWTSVEIISNIIHHNPQGDELYEELKRSHPFYCYVACDIAQYYLEKKDYLHAEYYLTDALDIVDNRAEKNILSLDTAGTTIYDDYMNVMNLLEGVLEKSNADSKKKELLKAKKQAVEKKSKLYSKSPKMEKLDNAMKELFTKIEIDETETSNAMRYYSYLKKFDINFKTREQVKSDIFPIKLVPEKFSSSTANYKNDQWEQRAKKKIGRNDPCPCGSGKKYKKCCLEQDRRETT